MWEKFFCTLGLIAIATAAYAESRLVHTDPPGRQIDNVGRPAHAVRNLVLAIDGDGAFVTFTHVALAKECAGHDKSQGPWFNLRLLDSNRSVIFSVVNLVEIMEPDAATNVQETIPVSEKIPKQFLSSARFVDGFMPTAGHCGH